MTDEAREKIERRSSILWDYFHRANNATWYWRIIIFHLLVWSSAQGIQSFNSLVQKITGPEWDAMHPFEKRKIYLNVAAPVLLLVAAWLTNTASRLGSEKKQRDASNVET